MGKNELIGLSDMKGNQLKNGDMVTNGRATFLIEWNPGFFAYVCYRNLMKSDYKFLYELADIIEEKYWKL